jgi:hypothetical protein
VAFVDLTLNPGKLRMDTQGKKLHCRENEIAILLLVNFSCFEMVTLDIKEKKQEKYGMLFLKQIVLKVSEVQNLESISKILINWTIFMSIFNF